MAHDKILKVDLMRYAASFLPMHASAIRNQHFGRRAYKFGDDITHFAMHSYELIHCLA